MIMHHDFPSIPWTRLPALRALAPEFYDTIPCHPSWPMVIFNFIFDDRVGMFARAKRLTKDARPACSATVLTPAEAQSASSSSSDTPATSDSEDESQSSVTSMEEPSQIRKRQSNRVGGVGEDD